VGWTKRNLVEKAFSTLALAGYVFDLDAEELDDALTSLDTMMATWAAQDINCGYAFGTSPDDTDLDMQSGLPLVAVKAAYLNLAIDIAATKGKQLQPSTRRGAAQAFSSLMSWVARQQLQQQQFRSGLPAGAGNKPWRYINRPFLPTPDTSPLQLAADGGLELTGD
jgi:hypothetical protein